MLSIFYLQLLHQDQYFHHFELDMLLVSQYEMYVLRFVLKRDKSIPMRTIYTVKGQNNVRSVLNRPAAKSR